MVDNAQQAPLATAQPEPWFGSRVLLVEDSRAVASLLAARIGSLDGVVCDIATCRGEAEAMLGLAAPRYFAAILDLDLADAAGSDLIDLIQRENIPVIVLAGQIDGAGRDAMFARGVADYVIKDSLVGIEYVARLVNRLAHNRGTKILVVDDSRAFRDYIGGLLTQHGYAVSTAEDGLEGLEMLRADLEIRLVISDFNMPRMDGLTMVSAVRKLRSHDELAIIGVSETSGQRTLERFLKGGATDYLSKPFSVEELYCRVDQNVDMLRVIRTARDVANRDFLTRLYNRRYFFEHARRMHRRAEDGEFELMLAMIDADHFKRINDSYGHQVGDEALVAIAAVLRDGVEGRGLVARFGGEEFVCLRVLDNTVDPQRCLDELRREIAAIEIRYHGERVPITASIGATTRLHATLDQMLTVADKAVYKAKHRGRDRVVID